MNGKAKKYLDLVADKARNILGDVNNIFNDLEEVESYEDTFVIDSTLERIQREAKDALYYLRNAEDYFTEGENK